MWGLVRSTGQFLFEVIAQEYLRALCIVRGKLLKKIVFPCSLQMIVKQWTDFFKKNCKTILYVLRDFYSVILPTWSFTVTISNKPTHFPTFLNVCVITYSWNCNLHSLVVLIFHRTVAQLLLDSTLKSHGLCWTTLNGSSPSCHMWWFYWNIASPIFFY